MARSRALPARASPVPWRRRNVNPRGCPHDGARVLDADLPPDPYPPEVFDAKVDAVFNHIVSALGDDGPSVYEQPDQATASRKGFRWPT